MPRVLVPSVVAFLLAPRSTEGFRTLVSGKLKQVHSLQESQLAASSNFETQPASGAREAPESTSEPHQGASEATFTLKSVGESNVDFSFMTTNFDYPGPRPKVWSSFRKWYGGGRPKDDLAKGSWQTDVVQGHICRQSPDQYNEQDSRRSYYASSMCYWIPEDGYKQPPMNKTPGLQVMGLSWGATLTGGQHFCDPRITSGSGQCIKCTLCHNNGRTAGGEQNAQDAIEVIPMPPGCLKERQIEQRSLSEFTGNHTHLTDEMEECSNLQGDIDMAQGNLDHNLQRQASRQSRIDSLVDQLASYRADLVQKQADRLGHLQLVQFARNSASTQCQPFCGETWCQMLTNFDFTGGQVLAQWPYFDCENHRVVQVECRQLRHVYLQANSSLSSNLNNQVSLQRSVDSKQAEKDATDRELAQRRSEEQSQLNQVNYSRSSAIGACRPFCGDGDCMPRNTGLTDWGHLFHRGWYDVQGCGRCSDYCRYVGTPWKWSCALAGEDDQYLGLLPYLMHLDWPYTRCDAERAPATGAWCQMLEQYHFSVGQVLQQWPNADCQEPRRPFCFEFDPECQRRMDEWRRQMQKHSECVTCKTSQSSLNNTWRTYESTLSRIRQLESDLVSINWDLDSLRSQLNSAKALEPSLRIALQRATDDYLPKKAVCDAECYTCKNSKGHVQQNWEQLAAIDSRISRLQQLIPEFEADAEAEQGRLQDDKDAEPGLRATLAAAKEVYAPKKMRCEEDLAGQYDALKRAWLLDSIPKLWDLSCEKACMEGARGCGVVEGMARAEIWVEPGVAVSPGMEVKCAPPFASFVNRPSKWGAPQETEADVCRRIYTTQRPARAQQVLIKGMLWKRGGMLRQWKQRYFVLESGDQLRSALMRYWPQAPASHFDEERVEKAVILWDAQSVRVERGNFGWRDGRQCFFLQHFYRDYRFCVPAQANAPALRDQWVSHINAAIMFRSSR